VIRRHLRRREQLADVHERPAIERRQVPVGQVGALFRRRRKTAHDAQLGGGSWFEGDLAHLLDSIAR
jgi:hypothetical protein